MQASSDSLNGLRPISLYRPVYARRCLQPVDRHYVDAAPPFRTRKRLLITDLQTSGRNLEEQVTQERINLVE